MAMSTPTYPTLPGGHALSPFRAQALLQKLQAIDDAIETLDAEWFYPLEVSAPGQGGALAGERLARLQLLVDEHPLPDAPDGKHQRSLWVTARQGTLSPWSSKAIDILHHAGFADVTRIERGIRWKLGFRHGLLGGSKAQDYPEAKLALLAACLHDPMTESWFTTAPDPARLFAPQHPAGPGAVGRRDRLPGPRLRRAGTRPHRCRADDVRAGQLRALPPQDLQRRLHHRRQAAGTVALRHDPRDPQGPPAGHGGGLFRQRRHPGRRHAGHLERGPGHRPLSLVRRAGASPAEGRDPQPPHGHCPPPGRSHRQWRRDP